MGTIAIERSNWSRKTIRIFRNNTINYRSTGCQKTGWDRVVHAYEDIDYSGLSSRSSPSTTTEIVSLAAEEILKKELDDDQGPFLMRFIVQLDGHNFADAYPRLRAAAEAILLGIGSSASQYNDDDKKLLSSAHLVLYKLYIRSVQDAKNPTSAIEHLKKSLDLSPNDWRLYSLMATEHLAIYKTTFALEYLDRSINLTTNNEVAKFDLEIRKAKVLFNLNRKEDVITTMNSVLKNYEDNYSNKGKSGSYSNKFKKSISNRLIARLAVGEYMLVQTYY